MILAAAIKIKVKKTGEEVILCGARHGDVFKQYKGLGLTHDDFEEVAEGFIDHHNNFLTRSDAYDYAKLCGQVCGKIIYEREVKGLFGKELISEDLW